MASADELQLPADWRAEIIERLAPLQPLKIIVFGSRSKRAVVDAAEQDLQQG